MPCLPLCRRDFLRSASIARAALGDLSFSPSLLQAQREAAPPERRLLQQRFPLAALEAALIPRERWIPWPKAADRAPWEALPAVARSALLARGEESLGKPWPALPATLFLEFKREGNRARYEAPFFARRNMLCDLALAECAEGKGRFLDQIINGAWAICEETYWGVPAHVSLQKAGTGLPDATEPTVDLFAAETGALLAWVNYLLGDKLAAVSPLVPRRISSEVERRILVPNAERIDFWWMGLDPGLQRAVNNWNPWVNSNWLACNLLEERDAGKRIRVTHKIVRSLDRFLDAYHSDGGCDEGPSYWGRAGGSLFDCLELLHTASSGKLSAWEVPLVQEIGRYIYRAHIAGNYYLNFADASARIRIESDLIYRYGKRIGDARMQALGSYGFHAPGDGSPGSVSSIGRALPAAFGLAELSATHLPEPLVRDVWLPGIEVMSARTAEGSAAGFYVAAKGGHNAESHNHNDVGNFIVYLNGQPALIDVGVETYSAKTFSSQRYEIWTMQSAYHSLPTINGVMQSPGRQYEARGVKYESGDAEVRFLLDLAGAYPPEANLREWKRELRFRRLENTITLTDRHTCTATPREITLSLMTPCTVTEEQPGELRLRSESLGATALAIRYNAADLAWKVEPIEIEDARLHTAWGTRLYRILLSHKNPKAAGTTELQLTQTT